MTEYAEYAELHAHSDFSFLDGSSDPEELVAEAARANASSVKTGRPFSPPSRCASANTVERRA